MELLQFMHDLGLPASFILVTTLSIIVIVFLRERFIAMVNAWRNRFAQLDHWVKTCVLCGHLLLFAVWIGMWFVCAILYLQMANFLK